ncbi:hypothetical protein [Vibrio sp. WXL210]|uniref:hypothetical protein n=1 Tax=Vibrio sp. WXL210 TaxID=3450709 RepID=UPI003EC7BD8E
MKYNKMFLKPMVIALTSVLFATNCGGESNRSTPDVEDPSDAYLVTVGRDNVTEHNGSIIISPSAWSSIVTNAANIGTIQLPEGDIRVGNLTINVDGIKVRGAGKNKTTIIRTVGEDNSGGPHGCMDNCQWQVFRIEADDVHFYDLTIKGDKPVEVESDYEEDSNYITEFPQMTQGVKRAFFLTKGKSQNFTMENVFVNDVYNGVEYQYSTLPHGLTLIDVDFSVWTKMVTVTLTSGDEFNQLYLNKPFLIDGVRHVNRDGEIKNSNRPLAVSGITFDMGNHGNTGDLDRRDDESIDLSGSVIRNCDFSMPNAKWNLGMTRVHNFEIHDNIFGGGGWGNDFFYHAIHIEDGGSETTPIKIYNNTIHQDGLNDEGKPINNVGHLWLGVTYSDFAPIVRLYDNKITGDLTEPDTGSDGFSDAYIIKRGAGFDLKTCDPVEVPYTEGNNVPSDQLFRAPGPESKQGGNIGACN